MRCARSNNAQALDAARALKRLWRRCRPDAFRTWAILATAEERQAAAEFLALSLDKGERRH
jgi:muconolactone delta-isomerase